MSTSQKTANLAADAPFRLGELVTVSGPPPRRRRYGTSLRRVPNGDLLATWHESAGTENGNDGCVMVARSTDEGRTWEHAVPIFAMPGYICSGLSGLKVLPNGTVLVAVGRYTRALPKDTTYGIEMYDNEIYVARSTDSGRTWGRLERLPQLYPEFIELWGNGDPIELRDGRLMFGVIGTRKPGGTSWVSGVTMTDPDARQWGAPTLIAASDQIEFNDTSLSRLDDGRIVGVIRTETPPFHLYQSYSSDEGASWSAPTQTGAQGSCPCVFRLRDGTVAFAYRDRKPGRPGVSVMHSRDAGASWRDVGQLYVSPDWFCGYPAVERLSDDTLLCVYFTAIVDGNSAIEAVRLVERG